MPRNLCRRKIRTSLTCVGLAIAVGTMVALLGISDGFERSTVESFEGRGVDIVVVADGVLDQLNSDLDERAADRIRALPGVQAVAPGLLELTEYPQDGTFISILVQGWEPDSFLFDDLKVLDGRSIRADDGRVAMLGVHLAENIEKTVGDTITIQREPFHIVGIYRSFSVYENGAVALPLKELQDVMVRDGSVTGISVVLDKSGDRQIPVESVCRQINALTDEQGRLLGLSAAATREYVSNAMHIRTAHAMAWLTSAIAVVVGAIGVLNTMIMSVTERVREISILRAIGWRRSRVVRMILGESLLLSLAGALLGSLGAVLLIKWLTTLPMASGFIGGEVAPVILVKGFVMALGVALIGGDFPLIWLRVCCLLKDYVMSKPLNESEVLRTRRLSKEYPDGRIHALTNVNLVIRRGDYVTIMGPSGSGKSTLLNILGALDRPTRGEVFLEGQSLASVKDLDRVRSQKIGFVFQSFCLLPTLTALENVQIPMFEGPLPGKARRRKACQLLEAVGMMHRASHLPPRLSVGERQRVAIARSLANDPVILMADEPTGNLDSRTADEVLDLFDRLHEERGMTLVVVSHNQEVAERAGRVIRLRDGSILADVEAEQRVANNL